MHKKLKVKKTSEKNLMKTKKMNKKLIKKLKSKNNFDSCMI